MTRLSKLISITTLVSFILACNFVTQPIRDVKNVAGTAQSFASALPVETLQALASQIPAETLQALPSMAPTLEALASAMPDFGKYFNPQGAPVEVWNDIPIMPQATVGQEFEGGVYSFKADTTVQEAQNFYKEKLPGLGWDESFSLPGDANGAAMLFSKESKILSVTIASTEGATLVILTLA
jgi:hypothetical protein